MFQKEEIQKHRCRIAYEKAKQSKASEDDLEIRCKRCDTKATQVSDVRRLGHDHLVLDKSFKGTPFLELRLKFDNTCIVKVYN